MFLFDLLKSGAPFLNMWLVFKIVAATCYIFNE